MVNNSLTDGQEWNGKIYYLNTTKATFSDHRESCKRNGMDLVVIESKDELRFITYRMMTSYEDAFIGAQCTNSFLNTFTNIDGSKMIENDWHSPSTCGCGVIIEGLCLDFGGAPCHREAHGICSTPNIRPVVEHLMSDFKFQVENEYHELNEKIDEIEHRIEKDEAVIQQIMIHLNLSDDDLEIQVAETHEELYETPTETIVISKEQLVSSSSASEPDFRNHFRAMASMAFFLMLICMIIGMQFFSKYQKTTDKNPRVLFTTDDQRIRLENIYSSEPKKVHINNQPKDDQHVYSSISILNQSFP